jgi:hypothetical protein
MMFSSLPQIAGGGGVVYRARVRIEWDFVEDALSLIQEMIKGKCLEVRHKLSSNCTTSITAAVIHLFYAFIN